MSQQPGTGPADPRTAALAFAYYRRLLAGDEVGRGHLHFQVAVLDRYLEAATSVMRSDTVGRVKAPSWSLDFGLAPGEGLLHAVTADLARLPEAERDHWLHHLWATQFSANYLAMLLHPGSCIEDGDTRVWGR